MKSLRNIRNGAETRGVNGSRRLKRPSVAVWNDEDLARKYTELQKNHESLLKAQHRQQDENVELEKHIDTLENEIARLSLKNWQHADNVQILRRAATKQRDMMMALIGGGVLLLPLVLVVGVILDRVEYSSPQARFLVVLTCVTAMLPLSVVLYALIIKGLKLWRRRGRRGSA